MTSFECFTTSFVKLIPSTNSMKAWNWMNHYKTIVVLASELTLILSSGSSFPAASAYVTCSSRAVTPSKQKTLNPRANINAMHINSGLLQIMHDCTDAWYSQQWRFFFLLNSGFAPCHEPSLWFGGSAGGCYPLLQLSQQEDPKLSLCSPDCQTLQKRLSSWTNTHRRKFIFSFDLEDVALGFWNTSYDTLSRRWSPQHWCDCSPGPHSAHGHCPCATHRLTCPASKEVTHLFALFIEHMLTHGAEICPSLHCFLSYSVS